METRIGEWYLCEGYIEEPVVVEALESDKIQVRYLTTGRTRWLGYPRIWHACKPQPLAYEAEFDPRTQLITLSATDGSEEPQQLSLSELRARAFPRSAKVRPARARRPARPAKAAYQEREAWDEDPLWSAESADASDDEEDFALDMSL